MILARVLSKIYKEGGIILQDEKGIKYVIGTPKPVNPITVKLLNRKLKYLLLIEPEYYFPEAYMNEEIVIENATLHDFLMEFVKNLGRGEITFYSKLVKKMFGVWRYISNFNTKSKSKKQISSHYDLGGKKGIKLYTNMLCKNMQYSCAIWKDDTKTLEDAQINKLNHIIKKLKIKKGDKILDIGCGFGTAAAYIAKRTGCEVTGITLSKNQLDYALQNAKNLNLDNQINFQLKDYRDMEGKFDKLYSIGMFEHTSLKYYNTFFKKTYDLLKENGTFLLHTIGVVGSPTAPSRWIGTRIFPGGRCPSYSQIIKPIEKSGFIVNDCETLIRHYDSTLEAWRERFLAKRGEMKDLFDEKFCKMWEFYLSSTSASFRFRDLCVYQIQLVKNFSTASRTRDYIYDSTVIK